MQIYTMAAKNKKRKSDAPRHESRLDYDQRSAAEDAAAAASASAGFGGGAGSGGGGGGAFGRADAETLAARRTLHAPSSAAGGGAVMVPAVAASRYRRQSYAFEMERLNSEFVLWSERRRSELKAKLLASGGSTGPAVAYAHAATEYVRRATLIKSKHSLCIGDVLTFGTGDCGQLGTPVASLPESQTYRRPRVVANLRGCRIVRVACGGLHNAALTEDGEVYTWGCNDDGSLGQFSFDLSAERVDTAYVPGRVSGFLPSSSPNPPPSSSSPTYESRPDEIIVSVSCGDVQTLCLSSTGNVYFFGSYKDREGKCWRDLVPPDDSRIEFERQLRTAEEMEDDQWTPPVPPRGKQRWPVHNHRIPGRAKEIYSGLCYNVAVLERDGTDEGSNKPQIVTWGMGECGELGRPVPPARADDGRYDLDAIKDRYLNPLPPVFGGPKLQSRTVESVACGGYHLLVVARDFGPNCGPDGRLALYSSGLNNYGQLGRGNVGSESTVHDTLERVEALDGMDVVKVAGGTHHTLCLDASGRNLWGFGRKDSGQLGSTDVQPEAGSYEARPVPIYLLHRVGNDENSNSANDEDGQEENPVIVQISCGSNHNLVTTESGDVYTWGYGDMGQLGHGRESDEYRPVRLDVMAAVNRLEAKANPGGTIGATVATVRQVCGGGQHSAAIVTRSVAP